MSKQKKTKKLFDGLDEGANVLISNIVSAIDDDVEDELTFNKMQGDGNVKLIPLDLLEDAPEEWNFFKPLPDAKFQNMKESIETDGLFHPILVWEREEGKRYTILSGHNRKRAYEELYKETGDEKYSHISAKVIRSRTMDADKARAIVSIANYAQRNVSPAEEFESLKAIYLLNENEGIAESKMENYELIQKQTGKDLSSIIRILNLDRLIPELFEMVGGDKPISVVAAQKLVTLSKEDQKWLYDNFKDKLDSQRVKKINSRMERDTIRSIFEDDVGQKYEGVTIYIPKKLEKEVNKLIRKWEKANNTVWNSKTE